MRIENLLQKALIVFAGVVANENEVRDSSQKGEVLFL